MRLDHCQYRRRTLSTFYQHINHCTPTPMGRVCGHWLPSSTCRLSLIHSARRHGMSVELAFLFKPGLASTTLLCALSRYSVAPRRARICCVAHGTKHLLHDILQSAVLIVLFLPARAVCCCRHLGVTSSCPCLHTRQELGTEIKPIPAVIDRDLYCR